MQDNTVENVRWQDLLRMVKKTIVRRRRGLESQVEENIASTLLKLNIRKNPRAFSGLLTSERAVVSGGVERTIT